MKTTIQMFLIFNFTACVSLALTGIDPSTNPPPESSFQLDGVQLNPDSFTVTLIIKTARLNIHYGIMAHDGPSASNATWKILPSKLSTGSTIEHLTI
jgi:hypothetical protein